MTKISILAIAPYQGMAKLLQKVAENRKDEVAMHIAVGNLDDGVRIAKELLLGRSFDLVLSRGGTAIRLREALPLPVIDIPFSVFDLLRKMAMFENYNGKCAFLGFPNLTSKAKTVCEILRKELDIFTIHCTEEAYATARQLKAEDYALVICDRISCRAAQSEGLNAVFITSSTESVNEGLDNALTFMENTAHLYRAKAVLAEVLMTDGTGTMITDAAGTVLFSSLAYQPDPVLAAKAQSLPSLFARTENTELVRTWEDRHYRIRKTAIEYEGTPYTIFRAAEIRQIAAKKGFITIESETRADSDGNSANLFGKTADFIKKYAPTSLPVLIFGEDGTGKEKTARLLYRSSPYQSKPFVLIDVPKATETEWEKLLAAPTSVLTENGFHIHFKNIDALSDRALLAFQQYAEDTALCQRSRITMSALLASGTLPRYQPLLDGCGCLQLILPSLAQRQSELPGILALQLDQLNQAYGKQITGFTEVASEKLLAYAWPGNLGQLYRVMKELVLTTEGTLVSAETVESVLATETALQQEYSHAPTTALDIHQPLDTINGAIARLLLAENGGSKEKTANHLQISRTTLWRLLKRTEV